MICEKVEKMIMQVSMECPFFGALQDYSATLYTKDKWFLAELIQPCVKQQWRLSALTAA